MARFNLSAGARRITEKKKFHPNAQVNGALPDLKEDIYRETLVSQSIESGLFHDVQPTSPLALALIDDIQLHGDLTAKDLAALDIMLAVAREVSSEDPERSLSLDRLSSALRLSRKDSIDDVIARINRAKVSFRIQHRNFFEEADHLSLVNVTRTTDIYGEHGLLFAFPPQVLRLLFGRLPYAHLELVALVLFTCKWSRRLYGRILRRVAEAALPAAGGEITFSMAPAELASAMGWSSDPFSFRDFKKAALQPAMADMVHLRRISVSKELRRSDARGRPVEGIDFTVRVRPIQRAAVRTALIHDDGYRRLRADGGRPEDPRLFVRPSVFLKAVSLFSEDFWKNWHHEAFFPQLRADRLSWAWDVAVHRALSGEGCDNLIGDVERLGADDAAWNFFVAQADYPDIVLYSDDFSEHSRASFARDDRAKAHRDRSPILLKEEPIVKVWQPEPEATREEWQDLKVEPDARDAGPTTPEADDADELVDKDDHDAEYMYLSPSSEIDIAAIEEGAEPESGDDEEPDTSLRHLTDEEYPAALRAWAEHGPYAVATKILHNKAVGGLGYERLSAFGRLEVVKLLKRAKKIGGNVMDFDAIGPIVKLCTEGSASSEVDLLSDEPMPEAC